MKTIILTIAIFSVSMHSLGQSQTQLLDTSNRIIILTVKSSRCDLYYGNGEGEQIKADFKVAKERELDAEEMNLAMVTNKILQNGWEIKEILTSSSSQMQESAISQIIFIRKN